MAVAIAITGEMKMNTLVLILCFLPKYAESPTEFCYLQNLPRIAETAVQYCNEREGRNPNYRLMVCREFDEHTDRGLLK